MAENPYAISPTLRGGTSRAQTIALVVGLIATALTLIQLFINAEEFYHSWMVGFLYPFALGIGGLAALMLQYMTGGAWGMVARRQFEAASRTIWFVAVLFIPIWFGMTQGHLYQWSHSDILAHDSVLREKSGYMNATWWTIRAILVFAIFFFWQWKLNSLSAQEEKNGDLNVSRKLMGWSSIGTVIYALALTCAGTDWIMSMDPKWFSTIFGLILLGGQGLAIFSFVILVTTFLMGEEPMKSIVTKRHLHDLGKFLFMFTLFWTYVSFSQLVIIWAGNLPEEITWYVNRMDGTWIVIGGVLLFMQWMLPFLLLLSQEVKRNIKKIRRMAIYLLVLRFADVVWLVEPNYHPKHLYISWSDVTAVIGLTGIWLFFFLAELKKRALIPVNAPDLERGLVYGPAR
jgi:hypothetical protein